MKTQLNIFILLLIVAMTAAKPVYSQLQHMHGVVLDSVTNTPVPYAAVGIKGGYQGTATNVDGGFTFNFNRNDGDTIQVSSLGYHSKEITTTFDNDTIWLKPTSTVLKDIQVFSKNVNERKIIKKALRSVKKNYVRDPFVMKCFFRQYCKSDSAYTRLTEAAFDVYYPKGYRRPLVKGRDFQKRLHMVQVRRLFNEYDNGIHPPVGIRTPLVNDIACNKGNIYPLYEDGSSRTYTLIDYGNLLQDYSFSLEKITSINDQKVYQIGFVKHNNSITNQIPPLIIHSGKLFINMHDYSIIRSEVEVDDFFKRSIVVDYKKYNDKYALFRVKITRGLESSPHLCHTEILNNELVLGKSDKEFVSSISREDLTSYKYDPEFWKNYNALKKNSLEKQIENSLRENAYKTLDEEYRDEQLLTVKTIQEEKEHQKTYDSIISHTEGLVCTVFWHSWGRFSLDKDYKKSIDHMQHYKDKGIKYVFVSTDFTRQFWKNYIHEHNLESERHLRIGANLEKEEKEELGIKRTIDFPQYMLHYNGIRIVDDVAPPYSEEFAETISPYLDEM